VKTTKVEITRKDGSVLRLTGDEAAKWEKAVEAQASFCMVHKQNYFPELAWEETSVAEAGGPG